MIGFDGVVRTPSIVCIVTAVLLLRLAGFLAPPQDQPPVGIRGDGKHPGPVAAFGGGASGWARAQRAAAVVKATTFFDDPKEIAKASRGLGEAMVGINVDEI